MRRALVAILFTLAAAAACAGQTPARQSKPAQPKPPQTSAEAARQELNLGARLYRAGRFAEAEQHFRRALDELAAEQSRDHRLGHHADADKGELRAAQGGGRGTLLRGVRHGDII